jgi:hypothetical protein
MTMQRFSSTLSSSVAAILMLAPSLAAAAGLAIEHKPVKCIVAGEFAKLNACFVPASFLARGRVYFRLEGTTPWFYVETRPDAPCQAGVFPKAKKELIGKHLEYYVQGIDRSFLEAQDEQNRALIVRSEQDCKDQPIAAITAKGPAAVFPALPAGFAAGAAVPTAVVAGGIAAAGGGAVVALRSGGNGTTTSTFIATTPPTPGTNPPATSPPPTAPPATPPPVPSVRCVPNFSVSPDPPEGTTPLEVTFDMCATTGSQRRFLYDFDGNGSIDLRGRSCSATRTYTPSEITARGTGTPATVTYVATVTAGCEDVGVFDTRRYEVRVTARRLTVNALEGPPPVRRIALSSQLDAPQAKGQVVVNGTAVVYTPSGRSMAVAQGRKGENRVEAQLVQAGGPGTWRFDLGATGTFEPGSLRAIAGEVVVVSADAVVFRLSGKPGERVVFAFRAGQ